MMREWELNLQQQRIGDEAQEEKSVKKAKQISNPFLVRGKPIDYVLFFNLLGRSFRHTN